MLIAVIAAIAELVRIAYLQLTGLRCHCGCLAGAADIVATQRRSGI